MRFKCVFQVQHPFYTNSGADTDLPHVRNIPLPAGTQRQDFRRAVKDHWDEPLDAFRPQLILFLGGLRRHAQGRIGSTVEGGYVLHALGRSAGAHVDALLGQGWRSLYG